MTIRSLLRSAAAILLLVIATTGAMADPALVGVYDAKGKTADNIAYGGEVDIQAHGEAVALAWRLEQGDEYVGLGLQVGDLLGTAFRSLHEPYEGFGIVVYRIEKGGLMRGIWMPEGPETVTGREDLRGPSNLEGRFDITRGENPGGRSRYTGYVDVERRGDTYHFHWYTPQDSYVGNGIRVGNVMVVGYALGGAPGTVAYCVRGTELAGVWSYGEDTRLGRETLRRRGAPPAADGGILSKAECLPTVAMRN